MDLSPTFLILVGVICVLLGFLASGLLNSIHSEGGADSESSSQAPPGARKGRYSPVVRLWRERGTGRLLVEIDGKSLVKAEALNKDQRERLVKAEVDLRAWLGVPAAPATPSSARVAPAQPAPVPAAKPDPLQAAAVAAPPVPQPVGVAVEPLPTPTVAQKSIVMQIEDILQEMIRDTPLAKQGVHLREDPARGVIVMIGMARYEGIDSVPDPQIKSILRAAVKAWEDR